MGLFIQVLALGFGGWRSVDARFDRRRPTIANGPVGGNRGGVARRHAAAALDQGAECANDNHGGVVLGGAISALTVLRRGRWGGGFWCHVERMDRVSPFYYQEHPPLVVGE